MENSENDSLYLKEVFLSGYKSINNVNIEFQRGLNIIIGKNAAGKTNFLSFLNNCLTLEFQDLNNFSSLLSFENGKNITIETNNNIVIRDLLKNSNLNSKVDSTLRISGKEVKGKNTFIRDKLVERNIFFDSSILCHGIPDNYLFISIPVNLKFEKQNTSNDLIKIFRDVEKPFFLRCFAFDLFFSMAGIDDIIDKNIESVLNKCFRRFSKLSEILATYTPIQDFRLSENFNIFINNYKFNINNLFIEFKVDGQWLPFSNLSDGTKRLFYIISEIFDDYLTSDFMLISNGSLARANEVSRIILLEEPELGIHPHQFLKLMEFLKEESEKKQILITTHSPQALDALDKNELNRIIVAYSTTDEGTKLRHLDENELIKANEYIKEDFLSDYWLYSDLEK